MVKKISLVLGVFFISLSIHAQVQINEERNITSLMETYTTLSKSNSYIDGWRIQIINTDDRRQMEAARSKFGSRFPYINMTWQHVQPYYQVKIGAYQTKLELESFLKELKADFPRAIPVRDKIEKTELLR